MNKKWFYVVFVLQWIESYHFFGTDEEMVTKLKKPKYGGKIMSDIEVLELTPQGKKKQRQDLVKSVFKIA